MKPVTVLIKVYDEVQQVVATHPVTFNAESLGDDFHTVTHYFKDFKDFWQQLLPEGALRCPIVDIEVVCDHRTVAITGV